MNVETVVFIEAYPMDNWSFEENHLHHHVFQK